MVLEMPRVFRSSSLYRLAPLASSEQRTGESVSATVVERQSATHIVTANCTYILPTMPW